MNGSAKYQLSVFDRNNNMVGFVGDRLSVSRAREDAKLFDDGGDIKSALAAAKDRYPHWDFVPTPPRGATA